MKNLLYHWTISGRCARVSITSGVSTIYAPMTGTTDMTGTDTNTDGAQRQGFRKVLRLRLITIRISDEVAESEPMEVETSRSSKDKSMRRPKAPKNYDRCRCVTDHM
eukprot:69730_1